MIYAIPTGKQNSFAAQNLPSFGLFVKRKGGVPVSLANAFSTPIRPVRDDDDLVGLSVNALTKHWDAIKELYGDQGIKVTSCFHLQQEKRLNGLAGSVKTSVDKAIHEVLRSDEETK
jgi:CRISPR-associated protein, Cse4 family